MPLSDSTRIWLHGLGAAFIGAAATSLSTILVAPDRFNLTSLAGFGHLMIVAIVSGVISAAGYLSKSPLPPVTQVVEQQKQIVSSGDQSTETTNTKVTTTAP